MKNTTGITNMTDAQIEALLYNDGKLECSCCNRREVPPRASMVKDPCFVDSYLCVVCCEFKPGPDGSEDGDFACSPDEC